MAANKKPTTVAISRAPPSETSHRMVQNFHLVWLVGSIDEVSNDDYHNSILKLRQVVNTVNTFTDVDECIDFITDINEERIFIVISGAVGKIIVPIVQEISQVSSVYIFCENKARHEKLVKEWSKVNGVYTDITPICEALKQAVQDCDHNSVSISFVKTTYGTFTENLDTLDSSFMYTQILKEILLTINFEQTHMDEFLMYCREQLIGNTTELKKVDKIETEYRDHQPIWWYTYQCFLYSMLNRALRLDIVIDQILFINDGIESICHERNAKCREFRLLVEKAE
jgi:hypothetical protein